jgi:hypothetical protein
MPLYSDATNGDSTSANFRSKDLVLIIIHSDAVAVIKVRDKKEGNSFYGQVQISPSPHKCLYAIIGLKLVLSGSANSGGLWAVLVHIRVSQ